MNSTIDITNAQAVLLSLPVLGAFTVLLVYIIKKVFRMDEAHAVHAVAVGVSSASALISYALQFSGLPFEVLGLTVPSVYGFSQGFYRAAKLAHEYLPNVQGVLSKVASLLHRQPASAAAAPSENLSPDIASEQSAASTNNEFNA